jgi:hypothetical protein
MMEAEIVSETLDINSIFMWLITKDFIAESEHESYKPLCLNIKSTLEPFISTSRLFNSVPHSENQAVVHCQMDEYLKTKLDLPCSNKQTNKQTNLGLNL